MKRIITLFFALATISFSFAQSNEILKAKRSVKETSVKSTLNDSAVSVNSTCPAISSQSVVSPSATTCEKLKWLIRRKFKKIKIRITIVFILYIIKGCRFKISFGTITF